MDCPECSSPNPPEAKRCQKCAASLDQSGGLTTTGGGMASGWSVPAPGAEGSGPVRTLANLQPGAMLAERYEIMQLLGEGGMGAVFKAKDLELDRIVALKVIRPDLAGKREVLERFKQELILARKVTHKNVIRIFDLGQAEGMKFITMDFIDGQDLKGMIRQKGKFEPKEAAAIMRQVCQALDAAHTEEVIHRDLKPPNIMVDKQGKASVMDFGIARSLVDAGLTMTGVLMGTPEYMSPEQAQGQKLDARSDLYAMGLIFYEMLTGKNPFKADSAMATLLKRIQETAKPPAEVDPNIPGPISDLIVKSLAKDPNERYQTAQHVLDDLETWMGTRPVTGAIVAPPPTLLASLRHWKWAAAGLGVLVLAVAGALFFREKTKPAAPAQQKVVTLLVADFKNDTGDQVFDGTLEPMVTIAMEGASFITSVNRAEARIVGRKLQPGAAKMDETLARLVAVSQGIHVVVTGSIAKSGDGYAVTLKALDGATGKEIAAQDTTASNKEKVLATVSKLAGPIRKALGDATPESVQIEAAETFSAGSLEAAHSYAKAQDLRSAGKVEDAIKTYHETVKLDPKMGSAYAGLAIALGNFGQRAEAEKNFQLALANIDRMTDREKYRTRAGYYLAVKNPEKAIEELGALVKQYPIDWAGLNNLAYAYHLRRDMPRAIEEARRSLQVYPKSMLARNNLAHYLMYASEFATAFKEAAVVLEQSPYIKSYLAQALSELAQGRVAEAAQVYQRLEKLGTLGASYSVQGMAGLALYEGRLNEAISLLEKGVEADLANNNPAAAARKFSALAYAHLTLGRKPQALAAAERAVAWNKDPSVLFPVARVYLGLAQEPKARALVAEMAKRFEPDPQAFAKLIEGEILLKKGSAREALTVFQESIKISDTWPARFNLARAYLELGAFTEADAEFDRCLKRRGEATEAFLDEVPTYHEFPPVHYYLGRAREGLKSAGAAESYKAFLAIKEKGDPDPLVEDARKRVVGR